MPATRPSDEGKDRSQWWKDTPIEDEQEHIPDPRNTPDVSGEMRKEKFNEEQFPYKRPSSG